MDFQDYTRFVLALVLVLGLIGLLVWLLRRVGFSATGGKGRRLSVAEVLMIGPRHRLLLVRRDDVEHLVLLGPAGHTVVEGGIRRPAGSAGDFASMLDSPEAKL
jgi:flagellar protein FliO/FliZ